MFSNAEIEPGPPLPISIYQRVLGAEFRLLEPRLQVYFGPIPHGREGVGEGVYRSAGLSARWLAPVFRVLGWWGIAFAEHGTDVPFGVRNRVGSDGALRAERVFRFPERSRTMSDSMREAGGALVDRIGPQGLIEVTLAVHVEGGALHLRSRRQALRAGRLRLPLPPVMTVELIERSAAENRQEVDVRVRMPLVGVVYGYAGSFTYALHCIDDAAVTAR